MSEGEPGYQIQKVPLVELVVNSQYGESRDNLAARWKVYERAVPYDDALERIYKMALVLGTDRQATVLDAGCNDASDLIRLREEYGHAGQMYGVDPFLDQSSEKLRAYTQAGQVVLVKSEVEDESTIPHASVDLLMAKFMLYHARDVSAALQKFKALLAPTGILMVATSGKNNKPRHREFEQAIADHLKIDPPPRFNKQFIAENAPAVLSEYFDVIDQYPGQLDMLYAYASYDRTNYQEYIDSLLSMEPSFGRRPSHIDFLRAIERVVIPEIEQSIKINGCFTEIIDRRYYACRQKTNIRIPDLPAQIWQ